MKKYLSVLLALTFISFSSEKAEASMGSVSVEPITGINQKEGVRSYLHNIIDTESYSERLEFSVRNKSNDEEVSVKVYPVNALTSTTGAIDYRPELETDHSRLLQTDKAFINHSTVESDLIVLKAGESKIVSMDVEIDKVQGTLLGGLAFQSLANVEMKEEGDTQFKINHEVTNVVAVLITNEEDSYKELEFDEVFLRPSPSYYNIVLPTKNASNHLIVNSDLKYVVKDADGNELFKSPENSKFNFAPNTEVNINFPWNSDKMVEGEEYSIEGEFVHSVNGVEKIEPFSKTFKYDKQVTADTGSFSVPEIEESDTWNKSLLIGLLLAFLLLALLLLLKKNQKYVLYSKEQVEPRSITLELEQYSKVTKYSKASSSLEPYKHLYKRKGKKYLYLSTELNNNDQKDEQS